MATKTEAELAAAVLRELTVIDASEDPAGSDDETLVIDAYEDKYAELAAPGLELVYWTMTAIPQAIFTTIRDLIVNEVQGSFGNPLAPADKQAQEEIILRKLRRHVSVAKSGLPTTAEYF